MSRNNQARVVEVIVEPSVLFDCTVKPWNIAEISKLQRVLDETYRYIWSKKKKGANKNTNGDRKSEYVWN